MIERTILQQIEQSACGATARIGTTKNNAAHAHVDERAGTHRARLFCDEEIAIGQAPIAHRGFGLRQGEHLCMSGGILEQLDLIKGARDNFSFARERACKVRERVFIARPKF